jgi:hypothetical protein
MLALSRLNGVDVPLDQHVIIAHTGGVFSRDLAGVGWAAGIGEIELIPGSVWGKSR